ncbi:MAG: hypothetical protein ACI4WR_05030 [Bulleidia sp.]
MEIYERPVRSYTLALEQICPLRLRFSEAVIARSENSICCQQRKSHAGMIAALNEYDEMQAHPDGF